MSLFSECFGKVKDRRNFTSAQIAERCGKDKSHVFYWQTGKKLPQKWEFLEKIIEYMQLFPEEERELRIAYEKTKYGEKKYAYYKAFYEIMDVLYQRCNESVVKQEQTDEIYVKKDVTDILRLKNKLEIVLETQRTFAYLEIQKKKSLYIKMCSFQPEILMMIKLFLSKVYDCQVVLIVCLRDFDEERGFQNLEIWKNALEIITQKNAVEVYMTKAWDGKEELGVNWILSDTFAIQFDMNCTQGMFYAQPQWLKFFHNSFQKLQQESQYVGGRAYDTKKYSFISKEKKVIGSSIGYMPKVFDDFCEATSNERLNIQWQSYFSYEGLIQFMETGIMEHFPAKQQKALSMEERCKVLQKMIHFMKIRERQYYILREAINVQKIYLEQVELPELHFAIEIHMGNSKSERYVIEGTGFQGKFKEFLEYLKDERYVYGEEESLRRMNGVLEEYRI